jgi:two-component system response regulator HydG
MASGNERELRMGMGGLIGVSVPMQRVYKLIHTVSAYHYPVLIVGESGTGKGLVARVIHALCRRNDKTFVSVSCAMGANAVTDSELFGHAPVPGASRSQQGLLAFAGHGTLFLDEVAELPLRLQTKLLQTLEGKAVWPLRSTWPMPFNARVISSAHGNLTEQVKAGAFREDLYLQLAASRIDLPPLRDRKIDIPLLVDFFVEKYADQGSNVRFSAAAMNYLHNYYWPGNIRELEDTVRRALSFALDPVSMDLRQELISESASANELLLIHELGIERDVMVRALRETGGDASAAARILGIRKSILDRRMKFYGLEF